MRRTLLIVDDHAGFRMLARAMLDAEGFDVVGEAGDGESALAEAHRLNPAVVLLDVVLPDLDGFAVCERLTAGGGLSSGGDDIEPRRLVVSSGARTQSVRSHRQGRPVWSGAESRLAGKPCIRSAGRWSLLEWRSRSVRSGACTSPRNRVFPVADGVVGMVLIVCGALAWERRGESLTGPLMLLAGIAWFAGTFASWALFWHRGPARAPPPIVPHRPTAPAASDRHRWTRLHRWGDHAARSANAVVLVGARRARWRWPRSTCSPGRLGRRDGLQGPRWRAPLAYSAVLAAVAAYSSPAGTSTL